MDKITQTNTTRILKFLQSFKLDFSNYSVWNYSRKKFRDDACSWPLITEALTVLENKGYIEPVRQAGYYKLTNKGKNFQSWELEELVETKIEVAEKNQKNWMSWLIGSKPASSVS